MDKPHKWAHGTYELPWRCSCGYTPTSGQDAAEHASKYITKLKVVAL